MEKNLDNNYFVGAVFMDLSTAFDCIPHDLLIAKLAAYCFDKKVLNYMYSYLNDQKQRVNINNMKNDFINIVSGVPHESIVSQILFNIFQTKFGLFGYCFPT